MINPRLRVTLLVIDALIAVVIVWLLVLSYVDRPQAGPKETIEIEAGETISTVAAQLEKQHIVSSARSYRIFGWFNSAAKHPRAGTYTIQPGTNYNAIARLFALGPEQQEVQLRIIEGWNLNDISALLVAQQVSSTAIQASMGLQADRAAFDINWREEFAFLRALPPSRSLEGYLFPDTYRVWQAQLPEGLVRKQLQEFNTKYGSSTVPAKIAPLKSLDDVVILASVIEKEVRLPEERRRVAGIFLRRLRLGIPLQSDATLSYVTGSKRDRATAQELGLNSPYNSYRFKGLPPTPICNPGATAIDAVLNPIMGTDLYFLTDKEGKVYYAATFEEHVRNKRKVGI